MTMTKCEVCGRDSTCGIRCADCTQALQYLTLRSVNIFERYDEELIIADLVDLRLSLIEESKDMSVSMRVAAAVMWASIVRGMKV